MVQREGVWAARRGPPLANAVGAMLSRGKVWGHTLHPQGWVRAGEGPQHPRSWGTPQSWRTPIPLGTPVPTAPDPDRWLTLGTVTLH